MRVSIYTLALLLLGSVFTNNAPGSEQTRASVTRPTQSRSTRSEGGRIIHVPDDFPAIQEAIDAASFGDEVVVAPGTYDERIIMRPGVDLTGAGADKTVVRSSYSVVRAASSCRISGFRLVGYNYGIHGVRVEDLQIADNIIGPLSDAGYSRNSVIGVYLQHSDRVVVSDNTIGPLRDTSRGDAAGITVEDCRDVTVVRNNINNVNEAAWGSGYGVRIISGERISLLNNLIYHVLETKWDEAVGIFCGGQSNTLLNNVVKYTRGTAWETAIGIKCTGSSHRISNNIVDEVYDTSVGPAPNVTYGIVDAGTDNVVSYNDVWRVNVTYLRGDPPAVLDWPGDGSSQGVSSPYRGMADRVMGPGNLNADPMFSAEWPPESNPYYMLKPGSPCSDSGDPDPAHNDIDGTRNDMGIYGGPHAFVPPRPADVAVFKYGTDPTRGEEMDYLIVVANVGEEVAPFVGLLDQLPPEVAYVSSDPPGRYDKASHTVGWYLGDLAAESQQSVTISVVVTGKVKDRTRLISESIVGTAAPEDDPVNNRTIHIASVGEKRRRTNDKSVSPAGFIADEQLLGYVIHYDVTRASQAAIVVIRDVLDANLSDDPVLVISNEGSYRREDRTITWRLEEPDERSRGFVSFFAVTRQGLVPGTEVSNAASIEFGDAPGLATPEVVSVVGTDLELGMQQLMGALELFRREMRVTDTPNQGGFVAKIDAAIAKVIAASEQQYDNREHLWRRTLGVAEGHMETLMRMINRQAGKQVQRAVANKWLTMAEAIIELLQSLNPSKSVVGHDQPAGIASAADGPVASLYPPSPNPFNPTTVIRYKTVMAGHVSLRVYDVNGGLVRILEEGHRSAGHHQVTWNGMNDRGAEMSSGVYFCRLITSGNEETRKMLLLK